MSHSSSRSTQKVALVTGGSSGIGRATADRLSERGYRVVTTTRRAVAADPAAPGPGVTLVTMDPADPAAVAHVVDTVISATGRLDVLVNNAGYGQYGGVEDVTDATARRQFDANVFGPAMVTRAVLPQMRRQRSGRIVMMSSVAGRVSSPFAGWYAASKYAIEALSDALRLEVAPFGIEVVLIEPGAIKTGFDGTALQELRDVTRLPEYREAAQAFGSSLARSYAGAPGPEIVARAVVRAAEARRPRTRYALPVSTSRSVIALKGILGDRGMDRLLASQLRSRPATPEADASPALG